jgi:hypothetical protein
LEFEEEVGERVRVSKKEDGMTVRNTFVIAALSSVLTVALLLALVAGAGATLAKPALEGEPALAAAVAAPVQEQYGADSPDAATPRELAATLDGADLQAVPKYLHISGSVFTALYGSTTFNYGGSGCVYATGSNPYLNYGLELPYDATVLTLRLYYKDTNASTAARLWLAEYDDGLDYTYVATATTTTNPGTGWGTATVNVNRMLDYDNYSYTLVWSQSTADNTLQLCGFRVGYTAPGTFGSVLPSIERSHVP